MKILPYTSAFQQEVINLILNIQLGEFNVDVTLNQQPDLMEIEIFYQVGKGNFWIAIHKNKLIGTLALLDTKDGNLALRKMFVHKEYRGSKTAIASKLLQVSINWAQENDISNILLGTVGQLKAAHKFYEKNGFISITREELPPAFPVMKVDHIFYKLSLK